MSELMVLLRWIGKVSGGEGDNGEKRVEGLGDLACRFLKLPFVCCSESAETFRFRNRPEM